MPRPNAGGGRRNQQQRGGARARFSRPPRSLADRFKRSSSSNEKKNRNDGSKSNNKNKSETGQRLVVKDAPLDKSVVQQKGLERLVLPQKMLSQLLRLFESSSSSLGEKEGESEDEDVSKKEQIVDAQIKSLPFSVASSSNLTSSSSSAVSNPTFTFYENLGFTKEEIITVFSKNLKSDDDKCLAMIIEAMKHSPPMKHEVSSLDVKVTENEDLKSELEVLSSIYGEDDVTSDIFFAFGYLPCCKISVVLSVKGQRIEIRMYIICAHQYPFPNSKVYGWLFMDAVADKIANVFLGNSRDLTLTAMEKIQLHQLQSDAPVAFDFVQALNESIPEYFKMSKEAMVTKDCSRESTVVKDLKNRKMEFSGSKPQFLKENGTSKKCNEVEANKTFKAPELPKMPVTFHIKSMEYRTAFSSALSRGLSRSAAQSVALEELEFVLPESALKDLRLEIEYDEAKQDRAFSLSKNISTKEIIEGSKILSNEFNINKAASKSLFLEAKDALISSGDEYARTDKLLVHKVIDCAKGIQKKKLIKKEEKKSGKKSKSAEVHEEGKQRGSRNSSRGLTIRDAYELADSFRADSSTGKDNEFSTTHSAGESSDSREVESRGSKQAEASMEKSLNLSHATISETKNFKNRDKNDEQTQLESRRMLNLLMNKRKMPNYKEWLRKRSLLPAYQMRNEILEAIENNRVVVVSGDTGCGKTTQIPQLVLDSFIDAGNGAQCNICVTQPRRISAVSVAEQIARERADSIGKTVGYHIRLEAVKSASTRLLMMTTGVLLRQLQADECNLDGVSHIFVDEVHERDINTDFLLIVLKQLLRSNLNIKVILMSATLNANMFLNYFGEVEFLKCTLISIPGRAFPVTDYYLEDAFEQTKYVLSPDSEFALEACKSKVGKKNGEKTSRDDIVSSLRKQKVYCEDTLKSVALTDESKINVDLIQQLVMHILLNDAYKGHSKGAILVFVPGLSDIRNVIDSLNERPEISGPKSFVKVFPLHSSLSTHEQNRVFNVLKNGMRKVIVSTNIAETSITIEDVVFVIDTCRVKENSYDEESQMNILQDQFISQANGRQRRGRAGRVQKGFCFHLVTRNSFNELSAYAEPEMQRMSLEDLILQVLALDLGDPYEFIGSALSPPPEHSVTNALLFLESLNAVSISQNNFYGGLYSSEITALGFHLAALPLSPRLGKLLLYGVLLHCLDPILTIVSIVSAKSPFVSSFYEREAADMAKQSFLFGNSDLLTAAHAFSSWKDEFYVSKDNGKRVVSADEDLFCKSNFLSLNNLRLIEQMRGQFLDLLKDIGFVDNSLRIHTLQTCNENANGSNLFIIKCALCAGMTPNILMVPPSAKDKKGGLNKKLMEIPLSSSRKGFSISTHPSSVLSSLTKLDGNYVAYLEAIKTSKVYARDVTTLSPLCLAMFGSKMVAKRQGLVVVNGWMTFSAVPDVCLCLNHVREEMEEAFVERVLNPGREHSLKWTKILDIIKKL